ncbi:hypothetical protein [Pseudomonas oryzicola]|uniref:hypothetical protein n=1 Tax=Pseudomonas oryzicola TaxID=485876 RepID=UPI003F59A3F0
MLHYGDHLRSVSDQLLQLLVGLGKVPAVFATLIYALPPLVRLTELGLSQIDPSLLQAAHGLGPCRWRCRASWPGSTSR